MAKTDVERLKEIQADVQADDETKSIGFNLYEVGLYNGLEFAIALLSGQMPKLRDIPQRYIHKIGDGDGLNN